jgi:hypothetical protein
MLLVDLLAPTQQASADRSQADFTKKLGDITQNLDAIKTQAALAQGNYLAGRQRMKGSHLLGAQSAAYASAGVDLGSGSAVSAGLSSKAMSDMDAAIIQNNAAREAWGYKVQGLQDKWQNQLQEWGLKDKANATLLTAGIQEAGEGLSLGFGGAMKGGWGNNV